MKAKRDVILFTLRQLGVEFIIYITLAKRYAHLSDLQKQTSEVSDRIIHKIRNHFGTETIEMKNLLRVMAAMRSEGRFGMFGMISDQSPTRESLHYFTQFLNQHTAVITGTNKIARKFDGPVYYARLKKLKRGYYTSELIPVSLHPKETPEFEISEKIHAFTRGRHPA